jgi:hypothetical protein
MLKYITLCIILFLFILFVFEPLTAFGLAPPTVEAFFNPTKLNPSARCTAENINPARFGNNYLQESYSVKDRIKICQGIDLFIEHSRKAEAKAGAVLIARMQALWSTFVDYKVRFIPLPKKLEKDVFVAAAAFPRKFRADEYQALVYLPAARAKDDFFFYSFWHELQHIHDIKNAWEDYGKVTNYALEFNGFYLTSMLAEVYQPGSWIGQPTFWRDDWKKFSLDRQNELRTEAIDYYIRNNPILKDAWNKYRADYNFTRPNH